MPGSPMRLDECVDEESVSVGLINEDGARDHRHQARWQGLGTLSVFGLVALMVVATATWATNARSGASELAPQKTEFLGLAADEGSGDGSEGWIATDAQAVVPVEQCSAKGENCWDTRCCSNPQQTCYMKDGAWAGCLDSCKPGHHATDPEEVRTPWTCFRVLPKVASATPSPVITTETVASTPAPSLAPIVVGEAAEGKFPTLFCFGIIRANTYELGLVKKQYALKASYFGCEEWAIFSDIETELAPGVKTIVLGDLSTGNGIATHFANTDIFSRAFDKLKEEGRMMKHDFIAKLDPDAVFFPSVLKAEIRKQVPTPALGAPGPNIYLKNCLFQDKLWMFGAVEVLSQAAVQAYFKGRDTVCKKALDYNNMGEDTFLAQCLDTLGVEAKSDFALLADGYCNEAPGDCKSGQVAYHPFKDPGSWEACFYSATR